MKKIFSFIFIIVLVSFSLFFVKKEEVLFDFFTEGQTEFYVKRESNLTFPTYAGVVDNGEFSFVSVNNKLAKLLMSRLNDIKGITIKSVQKESDIIDEFKIKVSYRENVNNEMHIFGFSNCFSNFVFLKGKKINVHIVVKSNSVVFATPIIYGSY